MPSVNIPTVGSVNFPDSMSPEEIQRVIETEILPGKKSGSVADAKPTDPGMPEWLQQMAKDNNPTAGMSGFEKFAAGYGSAIPTLATGIGQRMGLVSQEEAEAQKRMMAPLMETGAGMAGSVLGNVAAAAPIASVPGANTLAGSAITGGLLGAAQPTSADESAMKNAVLGAAGGAVGQKIGQGIGGLLTNRAAAKAAEKTANTVRDATLKAGQEAGYVVAPAATNPTAWNRLLQGLAGKTATGQRAAMLNQATTNRLAKEAIGLADETPLTPEILNGVRRQAGEAYNVLKQFDEIPLDNQYMDDVLKAAKPYMDTAKEFPELQNKDIQDAVKLATRNKVSGNGLIEVTKSLREKADAAFRSGDKQLGRVLKGISTAMEDAGERHLASTGDDAALQAFQESRKLIAKTYTIEKALNPSTGNIVASKLAAEVRKGKPITGGLKTAGNFAGAFPRETQEITNSSWLQMPGPSPLDWGAAAMGSLATGNPAMMASVAARPAAQALLTSKPYQSLMTTPKYAEGAMPKAVRGLLKTKAGQNLAKALGAQGLLGLWPDSNRENAL